MTPDEILAEIVGNPVARTVLYLTAAAIVALLAVAALGFAFRWMAGRRGWPPSDVSRLRLPFRVLAIVVAAWIAVDLALPRGNEGGDTVAHGFLIATIAAAAWFVCRILIFVVDLALAKYRTDVADNRVARRVRTQVLILRRLTIVLTVVVALAAILLTFPQAQAAGTSVLASAGLVSIIAGLAAQSALANVFAGMQIAFSGAIRVDDVVIVEEEWGRIEEITLTYVVVHIWDDRRMVLPSTYFTNTPFENWTRRTSELLGSVEFDLDWRVTPEEMRAEMHRVLNRTELWDKRVAVLQVTDAVGGFVRIRILVTAVDAPTLFDLRCYLREELVAWLHQKSPQSIPRQRVQLIEAEPPGRARSRAADAGQSGDRSLFAGEDPATVQRASQFTGPISALTQQEIEAARRR
ncbi:MAG: putative small-conductance mechanosensitive channel [Naasia sp.]|uniref:mechanosensitive ion channel family protein n=1 Tax=Naasia sp. TaxID=2546198 RepID=UPI0026177E6A|nr:mechanosensitive ion channel family protein [Naasia sp.]MCU1570471.1 putative small-conductance mechanosensitive channel [Naasia sp.]